MSGTTCCIFWTSWKPLFQQPSFSFRRKAIWDVEKISGKLFAWIANSESKSMLSRFTWKLHWWDTIFRVISKTRRVRETLKCGHGKQDSKSGWYSVQHAPGNREYDSEDSGGPSNTLASGNRECVQKVVQNMKDRIRRDEIITETLMNSEKMHTSMWTRFLASSMRAALHMSPSYESIKGVFGITSMMIEGISEIKNVFSADVASSLREKSVLLDDQAIKWTKARVYVYSDSVLCMGKCRKKGGLIKCQLWRCHTFRELYGFDGEPTFSTKFVQICKESTSHLKISVIE